MSEFILNNLLNPNEYTQKYYNLIQTNKYRKPEKYKTQKHHIIPKAYYKYIGEPVDNSSDNLVNLLYYDHVLAHYYLMKAAKEDSFRCSNASAVTKMLNHPISQLTEEECEALAQVKQEAHQIKKIERSKALKGRPSPMLNQHHSESAKKKASAQHKGRISIHNGVLQRFIWPSELESYLQDGWIQGVLPLSPERIAKAAASRRGKKQHLSNETRKHLSEVRSGRKVSAETRQKMSLSSQGRNAGGIYVHKGDQCKHISADVFDSYIAMGWEKGIPPRKSPPNQLGRLRIYKGAQRLRIWPSELESYLQDGWIQGAGRIWITKNQENKSIPSPDLNIYLERGWQRGRYRPRRKST